MIKISGLTSKDTLIDLGSGDGRILIAAARLGARAIGYEINPFLVYKSRQLIKQLKLEKFASVRWQSFWQADFNQATIITVYLFPHLMKRLQKILEKKLNHSLRVVCNDYPFPGLKPALKSKKIFLYYFK
jgi:cyclopropane fatty-acyl-phospholipid synthase-like methyltransferase